MSEESREDRILASIIEIESRPHLDAYAKAALDGLYLLLERAEAQTALKQAAS
jgi:hypothetical protein